MNKKRDLLARYFADLSKILFSATVVKQFIEHKLDVVNLVCGTILTVWLILLAYIIQPKE